MSWERVFNTGSLLAIAFIVGWQANSSYYNLAHLWQQKNQLQTIQAKTLPKLQAIIKCEHNRANTNEIIIDEAAMGNKPLPGEAAADCPHNGTK